MSVSIADTKPGHCGTAFLIFLGLWSSGEMAAAQDPIRPPVAVEVESRVDEYVQPYLTLHAFSGRVGGETGEGPACTGDTGTLD